MEEQTDWKNKLTSDRHKILRLKQTEPPFTGKLLHNKEIGTYVCGGCGAHLFTSDAKFDSGSGWPSFREGLTDNIETQVDITHGMERTEVLCKSCGGHLGHLFDDGPGPTGLRYCVNSLSLKFQS